MRLSGHAELLTPAALREQFGHGFRHIHNFAVTIGGRPLESG
jgi:hypothetical protein